MGFHKYIGLGLVFLVAACGGDTPVVSSPVTLSAADADFVLQSLSLDGDTVALGTVTKSETQGQWDAVQTLRYVALLDNGDTVGVPLTTIPARTQFSATGRAQAVVSARQSQYALSGGDIAARISDDGQSISVQLSWAGADIQAVNADVPDNVTVSLTSAAQGTSACGAANVLCGGQMTVVADATTLAADTPMAADQFRAGVYGATATDAELAGRISYVDPTVLSVIGSFVAGQN